MEVFVDRMNQKAQALGMTQTSFMEPTGLSVENQSTPEDYIKLARHLLNNPLFRQVTTTHNYTITAVRGKRNRAFTIRNTNRMLLQDTPVILSKTGFTVPAGRCLLMGAKGASGKEVLAVVMGANAAGSQYRDMQLLLKAVLDGPGGADMHF
jgi:D-alanyl-D-alanine endopeptidase (penicillin-binding protein 7)